jgi:hypothetical protein
MNLRIRRKAASNDPPSFTIQISPTGSWPPVAAATGRAHDHAAYAAAVREWLQAGG